MKKLTILTALAAVALAVGSIQRADAATSSQTLSYSGNTDWTQALAFDQFDSSLGTLQSVYIVLDGEIFTNITVENAVGAGSDSSGNVSTRVRWRLNDPLLLLGSATQNKIDMYAPEDGANYFLNPGQSLNLGPYTASDSWDETYTSGAILTEFTGNSTIALTIATLATTVSENSGGNFSALQSTTATANVTVVYTYEAVPEPTTALLVGAAGVAMAFSRRRRA
jgi:hypothetical protein